MVAAPARLAAFSVSGIPDSMSTSQAFFRGLLLGVLYAIAYALTAQAWSRWNLFGRIPLVLFRLEPRRTIKFLADARARGILRSGLLGGWVWWLIAEKPARALAEFGGGVLRVV
jgi:hypothetical protein